MAKANFLIRGEVQHVGLRANLIFLSAEYGIACKAKNLSDNKVAVVLHSELPDEIEYFYEFIKENDIREKHKIKTNEGYKVGDIKWIDKDYVLFDWTMYYSMVQAEAALKTMCVVKRIENKINKIRNPSESNNTFSGFSS